MKMFRNLLPFVAILAVLPGDSDAQQVDSSQFRDWELRCPAGSGATGPEGQPSSGCVLTQPLLLKDGRQLLALQIAAVGTGGEDSNEKRDYALILSAPLGVHLPSGARIQVDDTASLNLVFERCDEAGCYAGTLVSANLDSAMESGSDLTVAIQDLNGREITARMSLLGYTSGMQALRERDPG
jgi:invasion protein IalB